MHVYNNLMGQQTNTTKLNWFVIVYNVGSYGIIEHPLSGRACVVWFEYHIGYLATLVPLGQCIEHRLYVFYPKYNQQ